MIRSFLFFLLVVASTAAISAQPDALELIESSCLDCHDDSVQKGNLRLDTLDPISSAPGSAETWLKIYDRVAKGEMPPKKKAFSAEEIEEFTSILGAELRQYDTQKQESMGRVGLRRLSASEYQHIVRNLLFLPHLTVTEYLPEDMEYHGIKNVADRQDLAYNQIAQYLEAAEASLQAATALRPKPLGKTKRYGPTQLGAHRKVFPKAHVIAEDKLVLVKHPQESQGPWGLFPSSREPGRYRVRLHMQSTRIPDSAFDSGEPHPEVSPMLEPGQKNQTVSLAITLGRFLQTFDVKPELQTYEAEVWLHGGEGLCIQCSDLPQRGVRFVDGKKPKVWDGVAVEWVEIEGPIHETWPPQSHQALFGTLPTKRWQESDGSLAPRTLKIGTGKIRRPSVVKYYVDSQDPAKDSTRLLRRFMSRAYRRPVTDEEVATMQARVTTALEQGICFHDAMLIAYKAVLCSPDFLFVTEQPGPLSGNEVANRLALYLWRSLPDKELIDLGRSGELLKPETLRAQAQRLIEHPKSNRFINDFTDQWLELDAIYATAPDRKLYPEYYSDSGLVEALASETRRYMQHMVRRDLPIAHVVKSDFTYLNERLATHYDIPGVKGSQLRRVSLPADSVRGGILTHGSMMKISANGFTTSPIKRGTWVLERILGTPPPPPPPDAGAIEPDTRGAVTIREQLDKHRRVESCAACHLQIDPPGFALEPFDVMGAYRTHYRSIDKGQPLFIDRGIARYRTKVGLPVEAHDQFMGQDFADIHEFKDLLAKQDRQIAKNLLERLLIHATGGIATFTDREQIERILDAHEADGYRLQALILSIIETPMFLQK